MLTVHHLNDSRSQRILWLLEELELPYEIVRYERDPVTRLAPPALNAVHPLGKAPVLIDDGAIIVESGAIIDHLLRCYGGGRLQPATDSADYDAYIQWLHFAEGSAMLPLMLKLYTGRLGAAGAPLAPRIDSEIANNIGYFNDALTGRDWLVGSDLTGADIQMSFVGEIAGAFGILAPYANIATWVKRFQARPAYLRAIERGGPYAYASSSMSQ